MSKLEAALFYLFDSEVLVGALVAHVDDLYSTGTGKKYGRVPESFGERDLFEEESW